MILEIFQCLLKWWWFFNDNFTSKPKDRPDFVPVYVWNAWRKFLTDDCYLCSLCWRQYLPGYSTKPVESYLRRCCYPNFHSGTLLEWFCPISWFEAVGHLFFEKGPWKGYPSNLDHARWIPCFQESMLSFFLGCLILLCYYLQGMAWQLFEILICIVLKLTALWFNGYTGLCWVCLLMLLLIFYFSGIGVVTAVWSKPELASKFRGRSYV